jgi:hypothetical protein
VDRADGFPQQQVDIDTQARFSILVLWQRRHSLVNERSSLEITSQM